MDSQQFETHVNALTAEIAYVDQASMHGWHARSIPETA